MVRLGAVMLLVARLGQPPAQAQQHEVSFVFHTISWGMVAGQTARFTVANPEQRPAWQGMLFAQVTLLDASGAPIAASEEIAVPPGGLRSIDFGYDDLTLARDPNSGRVQTRARIRYRSFAILDRSHAVVPPTSLDLLDNRSGRATRLPAMPTELPVIVFAGRAVMGLAHGQTLRVTAVRRGEAPGPSRPPVEARVRLYDASGGLLAQRVESILAPESFQSFDFDRAALSSPGEPISGRLQLRVSVELLPADPKLFVRDPRSTGLLDASLELIDNSTGGTVAAVWLTTGFFEIVDPAGGVRLHP